MLINIPNQQIKISTIQRTADKMIHLTVTTAKSLKTKTELAHIEQETKKENRKKGKF